MLWNLVESSEIVLFCILSMGGPQGGLTPRSEHIVFYISIDTALCMHLLYFIE